MDWVEERLHMAFGDARVNAKREFFKVAPHRAIAALELAGTKDVSAEVEKVIEEICNARREEEREATQDDLQGFWASLLAPSVKFIRDDAIIAVVVDDGRP